VRISAEPKHFLRDKSVQVRSILEAFFKSRQEVLCV
jgi:hypothetical protein